MSALANGLEIIADFTKTLSMVVNSETLFRGHASETWGMKPSAFRNGAAGILKHSDLSEWKRISGRLIQPRPMDDIEWLVLAQHYGVATALLDWTANPLVALFFASEQVNDENASSDGMIWMTRRTEFQPTQSTATIEPFFENRKLPLLLDTSAMNIRSRTQDSVMTLHCDGENHYSREGFFPVRQTDKWDIRHALELFGLTPARIYSDLALAAADFKNDLEIRMMFG